MGDSTSVDVEEPSTRLLDRPLLANSIATWRCAAKRAMDAVLSMLLIVPLASTMLAVALMVKATSRGPVIFAHERVGRDGALFPCLKFRTMERDAEERLAHLLESDAAARIEFESTHKLKNDPRLTRVGSWLRATSLDELPQLFNVAWGHMSLVGPRPIVSAELRKYGSRQSYYTSVRPGVTGPWQVSGRSELSYDERVDLDTAYAAKPSLRDDLRILAKTVVVVVRGDGAC